MKMRYPILIFGGLCCSAWGFIYRPFPMPGDDPVLDLVLYHTPNFYIWVVRWYYAAPAVAVLVGGLFLISVWRVWFEDMGRQSDRSSNCCPLGPFLPTKTPGRASLSGRFTTRSKPSKSATLPGSLSRSAASIPEWPSSALSGPARPLPACTRSPSKSCPGRRAIPSAGRLAWCWKSRAISAMTSGRILADAGREEDYIELGMEGSFQWNPLSTKVLDSYSLAYTVSSLLNQLFGKGKEPFWQQAYTNLVRWIIELYRVFPGQWVTLRQVYHCAIDKELFAAKIKQAEAFVQQIRQGTVVISFDDYLSQRGPPFRLEMATIHPGEYLPHRPLSGARGQAQRTMKSPIRCSGPRAHGP